MNKLFLPLILLFSIACSGEKSKVESSLSNKNNPYEKEIKSLILESEKLEDDMARNIIFQSSTPRQRVEIRGVLAQVKNQLYFAMAKPKNTKGLDRLFLRKLDLDKIVIQRRDLEFLYSFNRELNTLLQKLAAYQNRRLKDFNWPLYTDQFSTGLGKFTTFSERSPWRAEERNRVSYATTRLRNDTSWLISPLLKLEFTNPALKLNHFLNIKLDNETELNSELVLKNSFKILVSTDYEFGDPALANWEEVELKNKFLIQDFNPLWSEKVDLTKYEGQTVSIALKITHESALIGNHGLMWQVNDFQILGATETITSADQIIIERKDPTVFTYKHNFIDGADAFTSIVSGDNPAMFEMTERNGDTYYQVNGFKNKSNGVHLVISPVIELKDKDYSFNLLQAIRFYNQPAKDRKYIRVLIGTDQADLNTIEWEELELKTVPDGSAWTPVLSEWYKLNRKNENIRIGFRYESGNGIEEYPNWSLYEIGIKEE